MIQPLTPSQKSSWFLYWLDLEDPVPNGDDYMLPTLVMVTDQRGVPVASPEVFEELDQVRAENFLASLIEKLGAPDRLLIAESDDWDVRAWRDFSQDFRVPIEFAKFADRQIHELQTISQHIVAHFGNADAPRAHDLPAMARGLVNTAMRVRSETKKVACLQKALESDEHCAEARVELADSEFRRAEWAAALAAYDDVIARERPRWVGQKPVWWTVFATRPYLRAIYGRAMTLWHQGQHPAAAEGLSDLLTINGKDHQGVRFLIPLVLLLTEDYESAQKFYDRYDANFPHDYIEPSFVMGRGLMHSYFGREAEAVACFTAGILKNIYLAPVLLEVPMPPEMIWQPSDRSDANFAREFTESYSVLWDRVPGARRSLRDAWESSAARVDTLVDHRVRMFEFQDQRYEPNYKKIWQNLVAEDEKMTAVDLG